MMVFHLGFPRNHVEGILGVLDGAPDVGALGRRRRRRRKRRRSSAQVKGGDDDTNRDSACDIGTFCHSYSNVL
jgi:hypothetical protein